MTKYYTSNKKETYQTKVNYLLCHFRKVNSKTEWQIWIELKIQSQKMCLDEKFWWKYLDLNISHNEANRLQTDYSLWIITHGYG